jgi:hypothetical protein
VVKDNRIALDQPSVLEQNAFDPEIVYLEVLRLALDDVEIGNGVEQSLDRFPVELSVRLRSRSPHRRSLAPVQHPELNTGLVRGQAHDPIHGVNLPHQMTFSKTSDRRIAGHRADRVAPMGHQRRSCTKTCGSSCSLAAGMTTANHHYIIFHTRLRETLFWGVTAESQGGTFHVKPG